MKDDFENEIEKVLNEEVVIPGSVLAKKEDAFNKIREKKVKKAKSSYKGKIAAALVVMTCLGGITFGNTAIAAIKNSLFNNIDGVQEAVDNGYVQELENNIMKDNGVEIKVNKILKDSKRLALSLNLKFEDEDLLKDFNVGRVYYKMIDDTGEEIQFTGSERNFKIDEESGELVYNEVLDFGEANMDRFRKISVEDFNNISGVNLKINKIDLLADSTVKFDPDTLPVLEEGTKEQLAEAGVQLYKVIDGTWETTVKLDDKFKNIQPIEYKASTNDDDIINVIDAKVLPTGMDMTFNYKGETLLSKDNLRGFIDISLVDDKGITYKASDHRDSGYDENTDSSVYSVTFNITSFDETNTMKLIFKDINGNTHEILLEKK